MSQQPNGNHTKIKVGLLGCTGVVGQQFIRLLQSHPYFDLTVLAASERSAGQKYINACTWRLNTDLPHKISTTTIVTCDPSHFTGCTAVFSALDSSVAEEIELKFAHAGYAVFSNARNYRMHTHVPILVPYANSQHIDTIKQQQQYMRYKGYIITNANCSSTGLVVALKPLLEKFGIQSVHVVTMQALSGAGYPGVASLDILDNVYPYISGEEDKMEIEPQKILGTITTDTHDNLFNYASFKTSAMCNRVPVLDGHTECVSVKLNKPYKDIDEIIQCLTDFTSECQTLKLPSASSTPLLVHTSNIRPQPRLDRDLENGMIVSVGRVRPCNLYDIKFNLVSHNTVIGAAGGSILNAELAVKKGYL